MTTTYYDRDEAAKHYDRMAFVDGRAAQGAELNGMQGALHGRIKGIGDAIMKDGDIVRKAGISVNATTGATSCESGAVYISGAVRGVEPASLQIPVVGIVSVGLYWVESIVTALEDPDLNQPAVGTRTYGQAGADRRRVVLNWGFAGDGQPGDFYAIYTVEDGVVRPKAPPPSLSAFTQQIASYDRDSTGGCYVISGLVARMDANLPTGEQLYFLSEGRARVRGMPLDMNVARRLVYAAQAELDEVDSEPHISATEAAQTIALDRAPCLGVPDVRITARRAVDVVHGGFMGAADLLPDSAVVAIESIVQNATTYQQGVDFQLTAGQINWALPGAEPAPGSTYHVVYQYMALVAPTNVTGSTLQVTGALQNTTILLTYQQQLPRIDAMCLRDDGAVVWLQGVSSRWAPAAPAVPANMLLLATVHQTWDARRRLVPNGVRMVDMQSIGNQQAQIDALREGLATLSLGVDATNRDAGLPRGMFSDPFLSDDRRDQGIAQTGAIVGGALCLPIAQTAHDMGLSMAGAVAPEHTAVAVVSQPMRTESMLVNPYMAFDPLPAAVALAPAVDRWVDVVDQWTSPATQRVSLTTASPRGDSVAVTTQVLGQTQRALEYLRQTTVTFTIKGFAPGEALQSVLFDDVPVVPAPLAGGALVADVGGVLRGTFAVPAHVPAGVRHVRFAGAGGTQGSQFYDGQGTQTILRKQQVTTTTSYEYTPPPQVNVSGAVFGPSVSTAAAAPPATASGFWGFGLMTPIPVAVSSEPAKTGACFGPGDPLAQTFTLDAPMQICGCDLWFTAAAGRNLVQIRETVAGMPAQVVLMEQRIDLATVHLDGTATRITWPPVALQAAHEYALVVMSDSATTALSIARLGEFDATLQRYATAQPYQVGVLLSSSNASTWTPHNDADLSFRLLRAEFSGATQAVDLGQVDVVGATDLMVLGYADRPGAAATCVFEIDLTIGGQTETIRVVDGQKIWLNAPYTGSMSLRARLSGTEQAAAVLHPGVQLVAGTIAATATYATRTIAAVPTNAPNGTTARLKVVLEADMPAGSALQVHMQSADAAGEPWIAVPYVPPLVQSVGVLENTYELPGIAAHQVRVRLTLTGGTTARPAIRNLRCMVL